MTQAIRERGGGGGELNGVTQDRSREAGGVLSAVDGWPYQGLTLTETRAAAAVCGGGGDGARLFSV